VAATSLQCNKSRTTTLDCVLQWYNPHAHHRRGAGASQALCASSAAQYRSAADTNMTANLARGTSWPASSCCQRTACYNTLLVLADTMLLTCVASGEHALHGTAPICLSCTTAEKVISLSSEAPARAQPCRSQCQQRTMPAGNSGTPPADTASPSSAASRSQLH
jgi:hypothetical protein